jgi:apolipoprotein N-acyltransferase
VTPDEGLAPARRAGGRTLEARLSRPWLSSGAAVLSGLLFALAFPPLEWVALLPLAPVPWLVTLLEEKSRLRAALSGFVFGLAFWCASIPWIYHVVTRFGGQSGVMGVVCLLILAAILAEWPAIVAFGVAAAAPAGSLSRLALFPLLWAASEHARSYVYGGFPWNLTGFALYRHPAWIQTASVWGVYGVGLLAMAGSCLLAAGAARRRLRPFAAAAALALLVGLFGAWRLTRASSPGTALTAALVQPGIPQETRLEAGAAADTYVAVIGQAREAAAKAPGLIVLPESALPTYWDASPALRADLMAVAGECRCPILFNDIETEPGGAYYNVARLVTSGGLAGAPYRKVHLVPFGEYVPLPKLFFFVRQVSTEIGEFSPASKPTLLEGQGLKIGMGVCYEITYDALAREETEQGANLLATISNDSWYGRAGAQPQHFAAAVLRSVENGRALLRAAITGISGAVDERGKILAELPADRKGTLVTSVRLLTKETAWTRWGHGLPWAADGAALAVLLYGVVRSLKRRRP